MSFELVDIHERHLLAGARRAPELVSDAKLEPADLSCELARKAWRALQTVAGDVGRVASVRELAILGEPDASRRHLLEQYLEECDEYPCRPPDVLTYADHVRAASVHRATMAISDRAGQFIRDGLSGPDLAGALASELATMAARGQRCPSKTFDEILEDVYEATFPADGGDQEATKVSTGIDLLDKALHGGWPLARVSVVGARPGMGKTSFLLRSAHVAAALGFSVHVITNEDPEHSMARRSWSQMSSVDFSHLSNRAEMSADEISRAQKARARFGEPRFKRVRITNATNKSAAEVIAAVNVHARKDGTNVVILDYLQQLASERGKNRYETLSDAMRSFGAAAANSGAAWIIGSQIKRIEGDIPRAQDFRDAGTIEEVAKLVLVLHRPGADAAQSSSVAVDDTMLIRIVKANEVARTDTYVEWDGARLMVCNNQPPGRYQ